MDLDDWFRGERDWRTLLELIEQLPRGSHYRAAIADDDEVAEVVYGLNIKGKSTPPLEGWTSELEALTSIKDTLMQLLFRGSNSRAPTHPRPETALDRVEKRRVDSKRDSVLGQLLPGKK